MDVQDLIEVTANFESLPKKEQIKLMSFFYCNVNNKEIFTSKEIRMEFEKQKLVPPSGISSIIPKMSKSKPPVFLSTKGGYSLHRNIQKELEEQYFGQTHKKEVSQTLRDLLPSLKGKEQKLFLEEAISCFEIKAYRASILMTWLLSIDCLYEYILTSPNLSAFNQALQKHGKYKKITIYKKEDFADIKEVDFIEILRTAKLISNDVRKILDEKLGIRNTCVHPNTVEIKDYKSIGFIQDLVENVIYKYQK